MSSVRSEKKSISVTAEGVGVRFGEAQVISDVSFSVKEGEIFVIMGPSGSGKSVLLRTLIGLLKPTDGRVLIGDMDASDPLTHHKVKTALVFQAGALFNSMSVFDNLAFYPREHRLAKEPEIREKVEEALEMLSLKEAADKIPAELSGGMRKRVAIARSLVMEPQLLLYDEPTSELDPTMAATISEVIATLREELNVTSIVVSHDRDLAANISDRMILLKNGTIRATGTAEEVMGTKSEEIEEFFRPEIDIENPRFRRQN
ncbi:ABC transporter ATP-binding protein [Puniceicoccus vermicola]|uniref:ATP-binding cassette domain-containing protein n=1 Tax=Puniceicoccus vermicola TaxID=388746 RepID=A0A7X1E5W4_9BACT|nr:ATP-binding cassette domain-containing protein [Puniceicoccus vermicola]MBC2602032.1 ATP-binding cassette domain-containing protein [Puniceicoccus vermicola]